MSLNRPLHYSVHTRLRFYHIKKALQGEKISSILDVGCGSGYFIEQLKSDYDVVWGVDTDNEVVIQNKESGLTNVLCASALSLPFPDQHFDALICSEVLEHISPKNQSLAILEMYRVLKNNGFLIITVPSSNGLRANSPLRHLGHQIPNTPEYHFTKGLTRSELITLLPPTTQFKIVQTTYAMFLASEIFMDITKLAYYRKHAMHGHADLVRVKNTPLFKIYSLIFPCLYVLFLLEDWLFSSLFKKGHILIMKLQKKIPE